MNGLEKIIQQIKNKGEEKKESIIEEAEEEAEEKISQAKEKAELERKRIIEKGKKEAEQIKRRKIASARRKAHQKKLEAREKIIQQVLKEAEKELTDLRGNNKKYKEILKNLIIAGGTAVGGGNLEVSVLKNDKKMLSEEEKREMSKKITEETESETKLNVKANLQNAGGGTIVRKSDGSISSDNTFKSRLQRTKQSLRKEIANILFEIDD